MFKAILDEEPTPATRLNPAVSPALQQIIEKALEKDRNLRYQHASEMRSDLARLKRDTQSGSTPAGTASAVFGRSRLKRMARAGLTIGSILLIIVLAVPTSRTVRDNRKPLVALSTRCGVASGEPVR